MSIYQEVTPAFRPTYLYIKQHSVTGKLYFGKTVQNPEKYYGSGKLWQRHIKKHGKEHIVNLWYELFDNKDELQEFALSFSQNMNIVESTQWLNLKPENGLDGTLPGTIFSVEHKLACSKPGKLNGMYGKTHSVSARIAMGETRKRKTKVGEIIPHMLGKTAPKLAAFNISRGIKIVQYNLLTKISTQFESAAAAAREINGSRGAVLFAANHAGKIYKNSYWHKLES